MIPRQAIGTGCGPILPDENNRQPKRESFTSFATKKKIFYGTKDACNAGLASLAYDALTMGGGADTLTARVDDDNGGAEQTAVVALTVTSSC